LKECALGEKGDITRYREEIKREACCGPKFLLLIKPVVDVVVSNGARNLEHPRFLSSDELKILRKKFWGSTIAHPELP
tara:strand:+ start:73 stop:306 length:234 start_codon:yes stop_codon:yes gene_type:complete